MNFDKYTKEYDKKILQNMNYISICIYIYLFHMLVLCKNKYYRSLDFMLQILTIKYLPTNNFINDYRKAYV